MGIYRPMRFLYHINRHPSPDPRARHHSISLVSGELSFRQDTVTHSVGNEQSRTMPLTNRGSPISPNMNTSSIQDTSKVASFPGRSRLQFLIAYCIYAYICILYSVFAYSMRSKTGGGNGLGTRLHQKDINIACLIPVLRNKISLFSGRDQAIDYHARFRCLVGVTKP